MIELARLVSGGCEFVHVGVPGGSAAWHLPPSAPHWCIPVERDPLIQRVLADPAGIQIPDLTRDPRTASHPWVTEHPRLRSFAGIAVRDPGGRVHCVLSVGDSGMREFSPEQLRGLAAVAAEIAGRLQGRPAPDLRLSTRLMVDQAGTDLPTLPVADPAERHARRRAIGVAVLYAVAGILWIIGSDRLVAEIAPQLSQLRVAQLVKGVGYVVVTAILLALLMLRYVRRGVVMERRQEQRQQLFELVVEGSSDPIFVKDLEGRFLMANTAFSLALGRPLDQVLGRTDAELLSPESARHTREIDNEVLRSGRAVTYEETVTVNGRVSTNLTTKTPYRGRSGEIRGLLGVARDISQQKRDEEARLRSFSLLEATLESTADGVLVVDAGGRVARFNRNFSTMWCVPPELLAQGSDEDLLAFACGQVENPDLFLARVRDLYSQPEAESFDVFRLKDGRTFERLSRPQRIGDRTVGRVWSFRDVTTRVRAEERLRQSRSQLRELTANLQIVREKERTRIAREIHDELGQSLTGLKMDVNWLNSRLPPEAVALRGKAAEMIALLDGTVQTVRRIATELRPGVLDTLGLEAALEWQVQEFARRCGVNARFTGPATPLELDEERRTAVFRICQESLTNVARYGQAREVEVCLQQHGNDLRLLVRDDGVGFTVAELSKKGSFGILGMRERARLLGGRLDLRSEPGRGTQVELLLPLSDTPRPGDALDSGI